MGLAACIRLAAAILACIGAAFGEEGGPAARRSRCESRIFCTGPLLRAVQESGIFADGKYFVDMVGKFSEDEILEKFSFLGAEPSRDQLAHFVNANFYPPGSELRIVLPRDWREEPQFIREILAAGAQGLADFARQVHSKWKTIIRYVDTSRICPNCASSVLPLPKPFVVPGGRFREMYYWDTYWIMEGLYASEMCDTATMMVENLVWLVENYGFVPNGSRSYYLNRSQPPLLCAIMQRYMMHCLSATADEEGGVEGVRSRWLAKVLPALDAEYAFWANFRSVSLPRQRPPDGQPSTGGDEEGASPPSHVLSRYFADTTEARPESFKEDMGLFATRKAREAPVEGEAAGSEAHDLFAHIASAAESGWDFSSRWFSGDHDDLSTIETANIIPVDLNFIMLRNEQLLASFHRAAGSPPAQAALYDERALRRKEAMDAYLQAGSEWRDYNFVRRTSAAMSKGNFFLSNLAPFFWSDEPSHLGGLEATEPPISSSMSGPTVETVDELFRSHGLLLFSHAGGIPNDLMHSHQQWDFPNVWPPLQHGMICAFEQLAHRLSVLEGGSGKEGGAKGEGRGAFWKRRALQLAQKMVNTAYCGNQTYGQFFEKYHAEMVGHPGGGGEYIVQDGFGWTNGVLLWIIKKYGTQLSVPSDCHNIVNPDGVGDKDGKASKSSTPLVSALVEGSWMLIVGGVALYIAGASAVIALVAHQERALATQMRRHMQDERGIIVSFPPLLGATHGAGMRRGGSQPKMRGRPAMVRSYLCDDLALVGLCHSDDRAVHLPAQ